MRRVIALLFFLIVTGLGGPAAWGAEWETDFEKAATKAKQTDRYLLADFSGSDWCGWCVKLDREVFSKTEFKKFAKENLVLALIDFPRSKPQTKKQKERNAALAAKYGVKGFPTVLLFSPDGALVGRTGYQPGGAAAYVEHLRAMIEQHKAVANQKPASPSEAK